VDRGKREGKKLAEVIEGIKQLQQSGASGEEDVSSERNSTSEGDSQGILARYDDD
jgi:hypothetical protein